MRAKILLPWFLCLSSLPAFPQKQPSPPVVVFWQDGFPAVDTAPVTRQELVSLFPQASFATSEQLGETLARDETHLLVLSFGSAFPEQDWEAIYKFLERGGGLLVLGGRPFSRPAYRDGNTWKLRPARLAYAKQLFINDYEPTPGSQGLEFHANEDFSFLGLPVFDWARAYSLTIRLSDEDLYARSGSGGMVDARLDPLVWGTSGGRRLSAPLVQIDHLENDFAGGRWILLPCELSPGFLASQAGRKLIPALVRQAIQGAEDFVVRPSWPLFLPGEPLTVQMRWQRLRAKPAAARLEIELSANQGEPQHLQFEIRPPEFPYSGQFTLPSTEAKGLHLLTARLYSGGELHAVYRTGFWLRDEAFLRSGPRVTVSKDSFEIDGQPQEIVGTTYMASDVQREFFMSPNPYIWDRDMAELRRAGFDMLRTGWWTAWDQITKQSGVVHEEMLRALEAYLMTARKHDLPVQFTFFAFTPEVLGGANPYLDPEALRRQEDLILAVVNRFKDVPYLIWDIINEPSFSNPERLWVTRPNGDKFESQVWNTWLKDRYKDRANLSQSWDTIPTPEPEPLPLPKEEDFSPKASYRTLRGANALQVYDYYLFAQQEFLHWVEVLRDAIRATGSKQLLTVGQDEGGGLDRPSPAFFAPAVDFTSTHPWWLLDALLWDSLVARQPGKPMLAQEVGVGRQLQIDASQRRSPDDQAALLERKMAIALGTGAGAIQWLWNVNAYMRDDNEVAIGAIRADRTEKPEATVLRQFAAFAAAASGHLTGPQSPEVAIVTSQTFQYSALNWLAVEAQMKAVRALHYYCHAPGYVVAENQLGEMGTPRLAILPSPHALTDDAWQALLKYVAGGGNLLITGSVERDPHWQITHRLAALGIEGVPEPVNYRQAQLKLETRTIPLSFSLEEQQYAEALRFSDGQSFHEVSWGKGKVYLARYPVELAEGLEPTAGLYDWVLHQVGVEPPFTGPTPSPGVLVRPVFFSDSILYLFVSESEQDEDIALRDNATGAEIRFRLPSERARLLLLRKPDGQVIARYGF